MMHNPPHPGEILRADYLEPLELSVTEAAKALGVTRKTLSAVVNERAGISPTIGSVESSKRGSDSNLGWCQPRRTASAPGA